MDVLYHWVGFLTFWALGLFVLAHGLRLFLVWPAAYAWHAAHGVYHATRLKACENRVSLFAELTRVWCNRCRDEVSRR